MTLKSQWGLSAQNSMERASTAAGTADTQKQIRHLSTSSMKNTSDIQLEKYKNGLKDI
jgi:hypothetical protein